MAHRSGPLTARPRPHRSNLRAKDPHSIEYSIIQQPGAAVRRTSAGHSLVTGDRRDARGFGRPTLQPISAAQSRSPFSQPSAGSHGTIRGRARTDLHCRALSWPASMSFGTPRRSGADIAPALLAILRDRLEVPDLEYDEQPQTLADGVTARAYGFRLALPPDSRAAGALVCRLFVGDFGTGDQTLVERALHNALAEQGFSVPRALASGRAGEDRTQRIALVRWR